MRAKSPSTLAFLRRISTPDDGAFRVCPIPGCGRPPQARAGRGASLIHCDRCCRRRNRHGDLVKKTYSAAELRPYLIAVKRFIKAHPKDFHLKESGRRLALLLEFAGPSQRIADFPNLRPSQKAQAVLARMRGKGVPSTKLLEIGLAVSAAVLDDPIRPIGTPGEYKIVQIAKRALRQASGYHSVYGPNNAYHRYPRSGGELLRCLGTLIEEACEPASRHLTRILKLKRDSFGSVSISPLPGSLT